MYVTQHALQSIVSLVRLLEGRILSGGTLIKLIFCSFGRGFRSFSRGFFLVEVHELQSNRDQSRQDQSQHCNLPRSGRFTVLFEVVRRSVNPQSTSDYQKREL